MVDAECFRCIFYSFNVVRRKSLVSAISSNTSYSDLQLMLSCRRSRTS